MAVKIRLTRMGKIRTPQYRIVVVDSRKKRDGKYLESVGIYHPKENPSRIELKQERVEHWLKVGAQPSDAVKSILCKTGDWQKFKGLPAPSKPLQVAEPKPNRNELYEAEIRAAGIDPEAKLAEAEEAAKKSGGAKRPAKNDKKKDTKSSAKAEKADKPVETNAKVDEGAAADVDTTKAEIAEAASDDADKKE
ncbi:30S ribosomal protein S16 [Natronoglycomyces albus]|uniref:Small ribosomal subunit protein bS16 n=1 Tax=Natronoglycomyces albus TaxID=2811108 RepID=A0A895XSJ5_9ACTN|nr:30S ribosomal protein S16 [Natronoglycomyces albus]QSB06205.1 30S ribosomal protein S16 [Natronoglycomyces albus]